MKEKLWCLLVTVLVLTTLPVAAQSPRGGDFQAVAEEIFADFATAVLTEDLELYTSIHCDDVRFITLFKLEADGAWRIYRGIFNPAPQPQA